MQQLTAIIGNLSDPEISKRVHHAGHHGGLEFLTIATDDLERRRLMARTDSGRDLAIALPRDQKLSDGAVLFLDHHSAIVVRAGEQRWLRLSPQNAVDALELGYHAGNLHWRVRFDGADLMVAQDGSPHLYVDRIQEMVSSGRVKVAEAKE